MKKVLSTMLFMLTAIYGQAAIAQRESTVPVPPSNVSRVGAGDVLDIRLLTASRELTLFRIKVTDEGLLEYPLAGEPFEVAGLTTDEIKDRLAAKLKIPVQVEIAERQNSAANAVSNASSQDQTTEGNVSKKSKKKRSDYNASGVSSDTSQTSLDQGRSNAATNSNAASTNSTASTANTSAASVATVAAKPAETTTTTNAIITQATKPGATSVAAATVTAPLTSIYRVGVGDVLDIRLLNATASRESTLFTVMDGGLIEYPLAGEPFEVAGLTTDEIKDRLASKIKIFDKPKITVSVREYISHTVIVTGLVNDSGSKTLSREAVPLYVVLASSPPRTEAARATIIRAGAPNIVVDLNDIAATGTLIRPGDVITITAAPPVQPQFFFVGGQVNLPGQKSFHTGLTLTQAVLASGGATRFANSKVKVSRQGLDGLLTTTEYDLKKIKQGKAPDPQLQPGDRVEVMRGRGW